jgi:hypothetical protein
MRREARHPAKYVGFHPSCDRVRVPTYRSEDTGGLTYSYHTGTLPVAEGQPVRGRLGYRERDGARWGEGPEPLYDPRHV